MGYRGNIRINYVHKASTAATQPQALALDPLILLSGLLETGFLALHDPGVAGEASLCTGKKLITCEESDPVGKTALLPYQFSAADEAWDPTDPAPVLHRA
jgi:hypothetical protein